MPSTLIPLWQQTAQLIPEQFLRQHPGCWIQHYDHTPAKDPTKAFSTPSFHPRVARWKQRQRCAVCFSLQEFSRARIKESLVSFRNLGVDIDLVPRQERQTLSLTEIDTRKEAYLQKRLLAFPLRP